MKPIATFVLVALAPIAFCQAGPPLPEQGRPGQGGLRGQGGPPMRGSGTPTRSEPTTTVTETVRLLGLRAVQSDLGLTQAEWNALNAFVRSSQGSALTEDAAYAAVSKILTEAQATRLRELLVQDMGYASLALSSVRARLDLTAEQTTSVTALTANLQTAKKAAVSAQAVVELQKTTSSALAKLLTPAQDAKLRTLAGRTLE